MLLAYHRHAGRRGAQHEYRRRADRAQARDCKWKAEVFDIGPLAGEHPVDGTEAGTHPAVRKRGARSRLTGGVIDSVGTPRDRRTASSYPNAMIIMPNAEPGARRRRGPYLFGDHGDSGAVVVNDANQVVGVHFGHPPPHRRPIPARPGGGLGTADR